MFSILSADSRSQGTAEGSSLIQWTPYLYKNIDGTWLRNRNYNFYQEKAPTIRSNIGSYIAKYERKNTNLGCAFSANDKYLIITGGKLRLDSSKVNSVSEEYAAISGNLGLLRLDDSLLMPAYGQEDQEGKIPSLKIMQNAQVRNASNPMNFDGEIDWGFDSYEFYDKTWNPQTTSYDKTLGNHFIVSTDPDKPTRILISTQKYNQLAEDIGLEAQYNLDRSKKVYSRFPVLLFELKDNYNDDEEDVSWELISSEKDPHFAWNKYIGGNESLESVYLFNFVGDVASDPYDIWNSSGSWFYNANYDSTKKRFALFCSEEKKFSKYYFGASEGWLRFAKASDEYPEVAYHLYEYREKKWWMLLKNNNGIVINRNANFDTPTLINSSDDFDRPINSEIINGPVSSRLWLIGETENDTLTQSVDIGTKVQVYSEINDALVSNQSSNSSWIKDKFFFDCDYGSGATFKANNIIQEYGNGYYKLQPKNINSLEVKFDLIFKNRENNESNALTHFLENQSIKVKEADPSENVLLYSQGIEGFQWDGASTFFPYDSTKTQGKKFYCETFSRKLVFENSSDISLSLKNYSSSILRISGEGGYIRPAPEYQEGEIYSYGDIVYHADSGRYYYYIASEPSSYAPAAFI
ncbi:MAG: hypothetical protein EBY39_10695, partial [Flavobacteriia bacterium]|nr:hypothetical protein [Flavobacteriia bacterium]